MCLAGRVLAWHMVPVRQVVPMLRFVLSRPLRAPLFALALVAAQSPAHAQTGSAEAQAEEAVAAPRVALLEREGYSDIRVEWTWLGRLRIVAWLDGQRREIILHPTTGEVLRDLSVPPATAYAQSDDDTSDSEAGSGTLTISVGESSVATDADTTATLTLDGGGDDIFTGDPARSAVGIGVAP